MKSPSEPSTQDLLDNLDVVAFYSDQIPGLRLNGHLNTKSVCPFGCGDDKSFSVEREKGLFNCHRCGVKGSPWGFLELKGYDPAQIRSTLLQFQRMSVLGRPSAKPSKPNDPGPIVATYDYVDEAGKLLFQVTRHDPKDFRQRHKGPDGKWINNIIGVRRVLYRLPELIAAVKAGWTIYIVEGEKDADAINNLESDGEFFATTAPMGAKAKWLPEYTQFLARANVVIVADKDASDLGVQRALDVQFHLKAIAKSVRIVMAKTGKDAADHLAVGHGLHELMPYVAPSSTAAGSRPWTPCTLEGVANPNVGGVEYIVDRFVPTGDIVGVVATFKSGKTLVLYALLLAVLLARKAFGIFAVPRPLRVIVFQEEMPSREDERRLRRLAIGMGIDPKQIPDFVTSGQLTFYNRVGLDLSSDEGIEQFHLAVRTANADLILIDSLIAVAGQYDVGNNGDMRRMFTAAFLPLTTEGRSIEYQHHKRKAVAGQRGKESDKDSFLGAQAIAAASGRMYALERIAEQDGAATNPTRFRCTLTIFGSWTPEEAVTTVLEICDVGEGTTVTAMDEPAQLSAGGMDDKQRAALFLRKIVRLRRVVKRKDAFSEVIEDLGLKERTVASGLAFAKKRGWVAVEPVPNGKKNEVQLVPGDRQEEPCDQ